MWSAFLFFLPIKLLHESVRARSNDRGRTIGAGSFDPSIFSQTILRILFFEKGLRMPRKKQISKMNGFHHVMFRDVNGENIFSDDRDRVRFCLLLQEGRSNVLTFVRLLKAYTLSYKLKNRRTGPIHSSHRSKACGNSLTSGF